MADHMDLDSVFSAIDAGDEVEGVSFSADNNPFDVSMSATDGMLMKPDV